MGPLLVIMAVFLIAKGKITLNAKKVIFAGHTFIKREDFENLNSKQKGEADNANQN